MERLKGFFELHSHTQRSLAKRRKNGKTLELSKLEILFGKHIARMINSIINYMEEASETREQ